MISVRNKRKVKLDKTYSSLENALVTPISIGGLLHLSLGGFRVDDTVLSGNLLTVPALVGGLLVPVLFQLLLEAGLELAGLTVLDVVASGSGGIRLEELDLVLDRSVKNLSLSNYGFESCRRRAVRAGESALMSRSNLANVRGESADICFYCLDTCQEVRVGQNVRTLLVHGCSGAVRWTSLRRSSLGRVSTVGIGSLGVAGAVV